MRLAVFALFAACGATASAPATSCPTCPEPPPPPPAAVEKAYWPALIAAKPAKAAPPELAQFGRLVGVWTCTGEQRGQDGKWTKSAAASTWTWFYTLGGRAVQDIWEQPTGVVGTNLRIYDPKTKAWEIQWTTGAMTYFEAITAKADGDDIVMRGEVSQGTAFPPHARKITFHQITADSFEWKYEATKPGGDSGWQEFSRLSCKRTASNLPL